MLVLGQGVFFGIGAYCMGMYLSLENMPDGSEMPSFMSLYSDFDIAAVVWQPFYHLWFAIAAAVARAGDRGGGARPARVHARACVARTSRCSRRRPPSCSR